MVHLLKSSPSGHLMSLHLTSLAKKAGVTLNLLKMRLTYSIGGAECMIPKYIIILVILT